MRKYVTVVETSNFTQAGRLRSHVTPHAGRMRSQVRATKYEDF